MKTKLQIDFEYQSHKAADKYKIPVDMWANLTTNERSALRYFCSTHPDVSGVDYINGNYSKFQSTIDGLEHQKMAGAKAAVLKQKEAAMKYGMSYEDYSQLSPKQKNALKTWVKRHLGKNGYDYLQFKSA